MNFKFLMPALAPLLFSGCITDGCYQNYSGSGAYCAPPSYCENNGSYYAPPQNYGRRSNGYGNYSDYGNRPDNHYNNPPQQYSPPPRQASNPPPSPPPAPAQPAPSYTSAEQPTGYKRDNQNSEPSVPNAPRSVAVPGNPLPSNFGKTGDPMLSRNQ